VLLGFGSEVSAHKPRVDHPPSRFVRGLIATFEAGVQEVKIDAYGVRVFDRPKTVGDYFIYRQHVGLDVALEALRESLRQRRSKSAEIDRHTNLFGVCQGRKPIP
jgi:hypothetical protein